MRFFYRRFVLLAAAFFLFTLANGQSQSGKQGEHVPGEFLVQLEKGHSIDKLLNDLASVNGASTGIELIDFLSPPMRVYHLKYDFSSSGVLDRKLLDEMEKHPAVSLAQFNHFVEMRDGLIPNDPEIGEQWHHVNDGSNGGTEDADIDSDEAWELTTGGLTATGDTIVVCVIEGGNFNHQDLAGNRWINHQEIPDNGIDDDDNGYIDDYEGWNVANDDDSGVDEGGHGTSVMGMIGGVGDNNTGGAGANWDVKLMSVAGENIFDEASVVEAYTYPLVMRERYNETEGDSGAFVVATNASWGIDNGNPDDVPIWCAFYDTLGTRGILNCGATANNNVDIDEVGDIPTACPSPYMVSVTATDNQDVRTFSAYGITQVDVGAPGDNIYTTQGNSGYGTTSGTSFASPLTAGVIGLLYSAPCESFIQQVKANPQAGADIVLEALYSGVDPIDNLSDEVVTGGRINAYNSLSLILSSSCGDTCLAPLSTNIVIENDTAVTLEWNTLSTENTFDLRYRAVDSEEWVEVSDLDTTEFVPEGLEWCTTYEYQLRSQCAGDSSAYSPSELFSTGGCCEAPQDLIVQDITTDQVNVLWSDVLAATEFDLSYRADGEVDWQELDAVSGNSYLLDQLDSCTTYEIRLFSQCSDSTSQEAEFIEFDTFGCGACLDLTYCTSASENSSEEYIDSLSIGPIENFSGNDGGYALFEEVDTVLMRNMEYPIELVPGFPDGSFEEYFRIWIDLDQDGEFEQGELIFDPGEAVEEAITDTILIPAEAELGNTRLRVSMKYQGFFGNPPEACEEEFSFGEVEDYCVEIVEIIAGMEDSPSIADLQIFPNPADNNFTLVVPLNARSQSELQYEVYDAVGRSVLSGQVSQNRTEIGVNDLQSGVYIIRLLDDESLIGRGRLIKK